MRLEKVNAENIEALLALCVFLDQQSFVASNRQSIIDAYICGISGGHVQPFGIFDGETPVGFLMISFGVDSGWKNAPEIAKDSYFLWRFMIDAQYQHRGFGRQALKLALDYIRTLPFGPSNTIWTSTEPDNVTAKRLYESFGFRETGEMDEEEIILSMKL